MKHIWKIHIADSLTNARNVLFLTICSEDRHSAAVSRAAETKQYKKFVKEHGFAVVRSVEFVGTLAN